MRYREKTARNMCNGKKQRGQDSERNCEVEVRFVQADMTGRHRRRGRKPNQQLAVLYVCGQSDHQNSPAQTTPALYN